VGSTPSRLNGNDWLYPLREDKKMEWNFLRASASMLVINLIYAMIALFLGVGALRLIDRKVLTRVDIEGEIQKGNIAAAILAASLLLFIAIIIGLSLSR
jgi:hypothetical protein